MIDLTIEDLVNGKIDPEALRLLQKQEKEPDRFVKVIKAEQKRVPWSNKIILPLQEHLYVVLNDSNQRIVKCFCGFEFGPLQINWKLNSLVFERDPADGKIYSEDGACDPTWMILREFYCPQCLAQLEVEAMPPGYPILFNFEPDIDAYFNDHPEEWKEIINSI